MALETLKDLKSINGYNIICMDELREKYPEKFNQSGAMDYSWFESTIRPHNFIYVRHDVNSISFTIQNGPVKEVGLNGCQVDQLIEVAKIMIQGLNEKFPCHHNIDAIRGLTDALYALAHRKQDRTKRGVEGYLKL